MERWAPRRGTINRISFDHAQRAFRRVGRARPVDDASRGRRGMGLQRPQVHHRSRDRSAPDGASSVLPEVPHGRRRALDRSRHVSDDGVGRGAAAALPRHGRLRAVPVQGPAARLQGGGDEARRRVRPEERHRAMAGRRDLQPAARRLQAAQCAESGVCARRHQALLVDHGPLRRRFVPAVSRRGQLRRSAHRTSRGSIRASRPSSSIATRRS